MPIRSHITDPKTSSHANLFTPFTDEKDPPNGLVTYTEPRRIWDGGIQFFTNPVQGIAMNVNGGTGAGATDIIHQGDVTKWVGTNVSGAGFTFDAAIATGTTSGTPGISFTGTNNDKGIFTRNIAIDASVYVSLTMWVYLTTWSIGNQVRMRLKLAGSTVGTVQLENYIKPGNIGTWQQISIPIGVGGFLIAGVTNVDELELRVRTGGLAKPIFDLDDITLTAAAGGGPLGPTMYTIEPTTDTPFKVNKISVFMGPLLADTTWASGTMPAIPYNSFFQVAALTFGITIIARRRGEIIFQGIFKQFSDFVRLPNVFLDSYGADATDGTNAWFKLTQDFEPSPIVLLPEYEDKISVTINDNLTGLDTFNMAARGFQEKKS